MSRRSRGRAAIFVVSLTLLAMPVLAAGGQREQAAHSVGISRFLTFLWRSFVQQLSFVRTEASGAPVVTSPDRSADLDPWG